MRNIGVIMLVLGSVACSNPAERQKRHWMDAIEQSAAMPVGSSPLDAYARYYTFKNGKVKGFYTLSYYPDEEGFNLPLGQRQWIDNPRMLPGIYDGGCSAVNVTYDTARRVIEQVSCNGSIEETAVLGHNGS